MGAPGLLMPELETRYCPNCEAPLKIPAGATSVKCAYCGAETAVRGATDPRRDIMDAVSRLMVEKGAAVHGAKSGGSQLAESQVVQGMEWPLPLKQSPASAKPTARPIWIPIAFLLGVGLAVAGGVVAVHHLRKGTLQWESNSAPVVADVNGDGVEDVLGLVNVRHGGHARVYVAAFSGKDFDELWRIGPFGSTSDAVGKTFVAVTGHAVAVADYRQLLHVYDLATGKPSFRLSLSDRAKRLCGSPDGKSLWVKVADGRNLLVELASEHGEPASRPSWCRASASEGFCSTCDQFNGNGQARAHCESERGRAGGVSIRYVLSDGTVRVGLGTKHPGTPVPMAVGLDGDHITWKRVIPQRDVARAKTGVVELADIADGLLIAQYKTGKGFGKPRLVAIDAKTGAVKWDVPLSNTSQQGSMASLMTISDRRIYLPHWTWLDVLDLKTGKHLATIGAW